MASIKGKLFEYFVTRLLISCGFQPVIPDGLLVYKGSPGLMVQGLQRRCSPLPTVANSVLFSNKTASWKAR